MLNYIRSTAKQKVMINPHRLYVYRHIINIGNFQKLYDVHRYLSIPDLLNYYLKFSYAKEITKFPYWTNSHQNFNNDYSQVFPLFADSFVLLWSFPEGVYNQILREAPWWHHLHNFETMNWTKNFRS